MENMRKRILILGTDLMMDTKKKVKALKAQGKQQLAILEDNWAKKTSEKLAAMQHNFDVEINHLDTKSNADLQLKEQLNLLEIKNQLITEMKGDILNQIKSSIQENYSQYINYLLQAISKNIEILQQDAILSVNLTDQEYFAANGLPPTMYNISLSDNTLEIIGGFELTSIDGNKTLIFSIENLLRRQEVVITREFNNAIRLGFE